MDHEGISNGYAFDARSIWTPHDLQVKPDPESLFQLPTLDKFGLDDLSKDFQHVLQIPELNLENDAAEHELEAVDSDIATFSVTSSRPGDQHDDAPADIWTLDLDLGKGDNARRLRTWEAFEKNDVPNAENVAYLSEAGPSAFDAVLASTQTEGTAKGVLPQDIMLQALYNLALGRSSIFFQWDLSKQTFIQTLEDVPISGHSLASHHSFTTKIIDCGSRYRVLSDHVAVNDSSERSCTALVALNGCVKSLLDSIDKHIVERKPHIQSLLQLQKLVEIPHHLLTVLSDLAESTKGLSSDEAVISALSDRVHELVGSENSLAEVLREILARVSTPWLERLCTDLGMRSIGTDQPFVELNTGELVDDLDNSVSEPAVTTRKLPGFVDSQDRELIRKTKGSAHLLRQYLPLHQIDAVQYPNIPENILRPQEHSIDLRDPVGPSRLLETTHDASDRLQTIAAHVSFSSGSGWNENLAWEAHETQQNYLASLGAHMSEPLVPTGSDLLSLTAASIFENSRPIGIAGGKGLSAELDFSPLDRLRPIIQSHSAHVNQSLLQHFFWDHRLRHHLDLQRQFHLLGNGDFVSRLAKALFSTETQSAERRRGRIPTGETMGLRLNTRTGQRWPPASSEVQLTLMGILAETYHSEQPQKVGTSKTKELPGGLSFSIRELPENEIDKVMDSGSIYALDFLKLQYTPPPPLDVILTSSSLEVYDNIFRFLLKFVRVLHVTTKLREGVAIGKDEGDQTSSSNSSIGFAHEAHQCMTVLMSHFMEMGIAAIWNNFLSSINTIENALKLEDESDKAPKHSLVTLDGLRETHESCLERMRGRLFLRRKQQKLRDAVEQVLTAVLKCASSLEGEDSTDEQADFAAFRNALRGFINLLRAAVDKPLKGNKAEEMLEEDAEAMRILLLRLNWNDAYA